MQKNFNFLIIFWQAIFFPVSFPEVTDNVLQVCSDLVGSLTQKPNLLFSITLVRGCRESQLLLGASLVGCHCVEMFCSRFPWKQALRLYHRRGSSVGVQSQLARWVVAVKPGHSHWKMQYAFGSSISRFFHQKLEKSQSFRRRCNLGSLLQHQCRLPGLR